MVSRDKATVFVGSWNNKLYAVDASTGVQCMHGGRTVQAIVGGSMVDAAPDPLPPPQWRGATLQCAVLMVLTAAVLFASRQSWSVPRRTFSPARPATARPATATEQHHLGGEGTIASTAVPLEKTSISMKLINGS